MRLSDQQNELPSGLQLGSGVRITGTQKIFTAGSYQTTSQSLDMAIVGNGFLSGAVLPDGSPAYTRNGQFHLNTDGTVVTASGLPVEPAVEVPVGAQNLTISDDGIVMATLQGEVDPVEVGQINLTNFVNPAGLASRGGNLFVATASSGDPVEGVPGTEGLGNIKQFTLESSNVSTVEELVNMISVQRAYEMNSKAIAAADQMMQYANQVL